MKDFLPSVGTLDNYVEPGKLTEGVRCDSGVQDGSEVSAAPQQPLAAGLSLSSQHVSGVSVSLCVLDFYVL